MNIRSIFGLMAGLVFTVSAGWYVVDIAKKRIQVSIVTFLILTAINISLLASLVAEHVWNSVPFIFVGLVSSVLICLLAFNNHKIYIKPLDIICLILGSIGFIIWLVTKRADYNLYILSIVNLIAFIPLITKSFREPQLETTLPWQLNLLASTFLILAVPSLAPVQWAVALRQFICSILINIGLIKGRKQRKFNG